jgi:membrane protease YdiL (CAAX protease family)
LGKREGLLIGTRLPPGPSALLEVGVLFLPAIPAYLWAWPVLEGTNLWILQCLAYAYILAGTLFIGLRRWRLRELGINRRGLWLSLICGLLILGGRTLVIATVDWEASLRPFNLARILGEFGFYFGLVGLGEELLFRGLIYQALDEWAGTRWAIWGSSLGFSLWHIFGQGPLVGAAMLFYGLMFALIRWRAGGILGLILVHGAIDLAAAQMMPDTDVLALGRPGILHPLWMVLGLGLLLFVPLYLWKIHPFKIRMFHKY